MAGEPQKDAAAVRIFPPGVPLLTVLAGIGLQRLWPLDPGLAVAEWLRWTVGGLIVVGAVLLLGLRSVMVMRRTGQSENPFTPSTEIVTAGPFGFTRNPMYLQMVLVCLGFAVALWNPWILFLTPVCALVLHAFAVLPEERYLEAKFGDAYRDYKHRVRRWI